MQKETEESNILLGQIAHNLKLKSLHVVRGGPCMTDPEGLVFNYLGMRDSCGNGFHVRIDENGRILGVGATINGAAYVIPVPVVLTP